MFSNIYGINMIILEKNLIQIGKFDKLRSEINFNKESVSKLTAKINKMSAT